MSTRFSFLRQLLFIFLSLIVCTQLYSQENPRPKVGLVLSGGGARGFAHIGVLKMLDSLEIPVDYIAGTSMGGIIGALYAVGYSGLEIESLVEQTDWREIFTDSPKRTDLPFFQRKETGKYLLEFGLQGLKPVPPAGLIYGQKISLLFSGLTFPYESIHDFSKLPIPFYCVAVNVAKGEQVVLKEGSLSKAMRATMAIPSVFSPVEWGDSLLVDGGMLNNMPVDVVKQMGADIVIAVDVGSPLMEKEQLNSAVAVLEQSMSMMGLAAWRENMKSVDVYIQPNLTGYTLADFQDNKVLGIIHQGDEAARRMMPVLQTFKTTNVLQRVMQSSDCPIFTKPPKIQDIQISGYQTIPLETIYSALNVSSGQVFDRSGFLSKIAALQVSGKFEKIHYEIIPMSNTSIQLRVRVAERNKPIIHGITITGNENLPFRYIYQLLGLKPMDRLDTEDLDRRIMEAYGLGYFESIRYEIEPKGEQLVQLNIFVKEHRKRKLRLGLRYDDKFKLVAVVGVQGTNFLIPGLRYEHEFQFAGLRQYHFKTYYPSRTLNLPVYPYARFLQKNIPIYIYEPREGKKIASYKDNTTTIAGGIGMLLSKALNIEVEYQTEFVNINPDIALTDPILFPTWKETLRKIYASLVLDFLDDRLTPNSGCYVEAKMEASDAQLKTDVVYTVYSVSADCYHTFFNSHTLRLFGFYGNGDKVPVYKYHNMGNPHYFVGLDYDQLFGSELSILRMDYRLRVHPLLYVKLIANGAFHVRQGDVYSDVLKDNIWGYGMGLKVLSLVGPLELTWSYGDKNFAANREKNHVFYVTMGADIGKYLY